jgi:hypothetical protein
VVPIAVGATVGATVGAAVVVGGVAGWVTDDADGACDEHPAILTERIIKNVIKIIIKAMDCFLMFKTYPYTTINVSINLKRISCLV